MARSKQSYVNYNLDTNNKVSREGKALGDQVFAVTEQFCENNGVDYLLLNMLKKLKKWRICIKGPQSLYDCPKRTPYLL